MPRRRRKSGSDPFGMGYLTLDDFMPKPARERKKKPKTSRRSSGSLFDAILDLAKGVRDKRTRERIQLEKEEKERERTVAEVRKKQEAESRRQREEQARLKQEADEAQRQEAEQQANIRFTQLVSLSPTQFEQVVAVIFARRGFAIVQHTGRTGDGGVDLRLQRDGLNFIVQCKRYSEKTVGSPEVRDFFAAFVDSGASHGYFVTTSKFTSQATQFAEHKPITLVDRDTLKVWIDELISSNKA